MQTAEIPPTKESVLALGTHSGPDRLISTPKGVYQDPAICDRFGGGGRSGCFEGIPEATEEVFGPSQVVVTPSKRFSDQPESGG